MTTPKKQPGKKTLRIVYGSREKSDPKALLKLVNDVLKDEGVRIAAKEEKPEPEPAESEEKRAALEHLEAAALQAAAKMLDDKAAKIEQNQPKKQGGKKQGGKKRTPSNPQKQAQARSKLSLWLEKKAEAAGFYVVTAFLRGAKKAIFG